MYLNIGEVDGLMEESNGNKYLTFAPTDGNKEALAKFTILWNEIKYLIETINEGKVGEYGKDFMKIKFNSDDNLLLNKKLKLHIITIIARSSFEEDARYKSLVFLEECLYEF